MREWSDLKAALAKSPFRSRFHLTERDRQMIAEKGWTVIEGQVRRIIAMRLAPAQPLHDGKQTPMRGHPVFKAQHATGSCCRDCLQKWHYIPRNRPLTDEEQNSVCRNLMCWLREQAGDLSGLDATPDLFPETNANHYITDC